MGAISTPSRRMVTVVLFHPYQVVVEDPGMRSHGLCGRIRVAGKHSVDNGSMQAGRMDGTGGIRPHFLDDLSAHFEQRIDKGLQEPIPAHLGQDEMHPGCRGNIFAQRGAGGVLSFIFMIVKIPLNFNWKLIVFLDKIFYIFYRVNVRP
jgi:hypothetical protein